MSRLAPIAIVYRLSPQETPTAAANQMELAVLKGHAGRVTGLSFSPDGQLLVSASEDKTLRSWQVTAELARARSNQMRAKGAPWSPATGGKR